MYMYICVLVLHSKIIDNSKVHSPTSSYDYCEDIHVLIYTCTDMYSIKTHSKTMCGLITTCNDVLP